MPTSRRSASAAASAAGPTEGDGASASAGLSAGGARVLKKYPNRRLYDTTTSAYITLADVKAMVLKSEAFIVRDAKTGEDLTRAILLQIILEEEAGGLPMFSEAMLANIIRFYGHAMQGMMGAYMEKNLQHFVEMQQRFSDQAKGLPSGAALPTDLWNQFLSGQAPVMQNLMGSYLEQSKNAFVQMQEQMAKQAGALFPGMPGFVPPKR